MRKWLMTDLMCVVILMAGGVLPVQIDKQGWNVFTISASAGTFVGAVAVFIWLWGIDRKLKAKGGDKI